MVHKLLIIIIIKIIRAAKKFRNSLKIKINFFKNTFYAFCPRHSNLIIFGSTAII